jgi:predicted transcriptional regulator of viral defense system
MALLTHNLMHFGLMTATSTGLINKTVTLLRKQGPILRLSELLRRGVHRDTLWAMRDQGLVEQVSRGLYRLADSEPLAQPDLVTVSMRVPGAVICLVSALALHELTTQIPHAVDIALKQGRRRPRIEHPPIRVYWWSTAALTEGIEKRSFGGVEVLVTNPERSVADAFRYRNRLGVDLAVEALRAWKARRGARPEKLLTAARAVRAEKVIRPYLEALL